MIRPLLCHPPAFELLQSELPRIESSDGLVRAAIAISLHAFDDVDPRVVEDRFDDWADRIRRRARGRQPQARLAHLHEVLFEEESFFGNSLDFYSPLNSFLPVVLESRRGSPITLSLVYKAVAERVGLRVVGLNLPGHFLVAVISPTEQLVVDPFRGGVLLGTADLRLRYAQYMPRIARGRPLPVASHKQWISRLIANLQHIFSALDRTEDLAAMNEMQDLIGTFGR